MTSPTIPVPTDTVLVPRAKLQAFADKAEKAASIIERNLYHQREKVADARAFSTEIACDLRAILAASPALASPVQAADVPLYRFLADGELLQAGDECPDDDALNWEPVPSCFFKCRYRRGGIIKTVRRQVSLASPVPSDAGVMGLEWDELHGYAGRCKTPFGWAIIVQQSAGDYKLEVPWEVDEDFYGTVDQCRTQLADDLTARIRSCLVPSVGMDQEAVALDNASEADILAGIDLPPMTGNAAADLFQVAVRALSAERAKRIALEAQVAKLTAAMCELLEACEADCGVPDENDGDDEAVGGSLEGPMALTFGMLRRARAALPTPPASQGDASRDGGEAV